MNHPLFHQQPPLALAMTPTVGMATPSSSSSSSGMLPQASQQQQPMQHMQQQQPAMQPYRRQTHTPHDDDDEHEDDGSGAGQEDDGDSDDVEVTGVTGDSINQLGWASVCTMVDCRRPSNLTCEFYDEQGRCSTDTICCYECATGEGHSAACDATAADAEDDGSSDGGSTAGDDMYAPVGNTNEDIDAFFVSMAAQVRDLVLESHGAPAPEP